MGMPAARVTDFHACPMVTPGTPPVPHVGGPIIPPAAVTVFTGKLIQARMGDMAVCVGPPDSIAMGSMTVYVRGQQAARMLDPTVHGGKIMKGEPTVLIGDGGGGGAAALEMALAALIKAEGGDALGVAMAKAMIAAAKEGKPFCEQCTKAALIAQGFK